MRSTGYREAKKDSWPQQCREEGGPKKKRELFLAVSRPTNASVDPSGEIATWPPSPDSNFTPPPISTVDLTAPMVEEGFETDVPIQRPAATPATAIMPNIPHLRYRSSPEVSSSAFVAGIADREVRVLVIDGREAVILLARCRLDSRLYLFNSSAT